MSIFQAPAPRKKKVGNKMHSEADRPNSAQPAWDSSQMSAAFSPKTQSCFVHVKSSPKTKRNEYRYFENLWNIS